MIKSKKVNLVDWKKYNSKHGLCQLSWRDGYAKLKYNNIYGKIYYYIKIRWENEERFKYNWFNKWKTYYT